MDLLEIKSHGVTTKYVELREYSDNMNILGVGEHVDILLHAISVLRKSESNCGDNPFFKQVGSLNRKLLQVKRNLESNNKK